MSKRGNVLLVTAGLGANKIFTTEKTMVLNLEDFRLKEVNKQPEYSLEKTIRMWSEQLRSVDANTMSTGAVSLAYDDEFPQNLIDSIRMFQGAGYEQIIIAGRHADVNLGYKVAFQALEKEKLSPIFLYPGKECKYEWLTRLFTEEKMSNTQVAFQEREWDRLQKGWLSLSRRLPMRSNQEFLNLISFNDPVFCQEYTNVPAEERNEEYICVIEERA